VERNEVVLIDTSSWIEALRASGKISIRERVKNLMIDGAAAWCDMVTVELWNGARGHSEKKKVKTIYLHSHNAFVNSFLRTISYADIYYCR